MVPSASNAAKPADAKPEEQKGSRFHEDREVLEGFRTSAIQQSLSRLKLLLDALQTQVSGLNAEYLSMDDPGHCGGPETRMHRATLEMQRVQQDIEKQTKAAADLQEEARKSGIPAGPGPLATRNSLTPIARPGAVSATRISPLSILLGEIHGLCVDHLLHQIHACSRVAGSRLSKH